MKKRLITPYKTIGIIGGGQLGKMMALSAKTMGYYVVVIDPSPDCPCGQVSDTHIQADYNDINAIKELACASDIITYEFENIDYSCLNYLEGNSYLPQGSKLLKISQNRYMEKEAINKIGIKTAPYSLINTKEELYDNISYPSVLKTTIGGYDGKGQVVIKNDSDLKNAINLLKNQCILEKWVDFSKEISVIVTGSVNGELSVFPVSENIHVDNILYQSIVPARISPDIEKEAIDYALKIAKNFNLVGTLAVEMFVTKDDEIYVNEVAPRPHNSGHYTLDACETSQFEQHIRGICGLPLGSTKLLTPVVMVNILGKHIQKFFDYIPLLSTAKIHIYGKREARDKRKMGHINILSNNLEDTFNYINTSGIWQ